MPTLTKNDGNIVAGLIIGVVAYRKFIQPIVKGWL